MKKAVKIIGLCFVTALIILGIRMAIPPKTLDFRGTVTEIEAAEHGVVFHVSLFDASYTVLANSKTKVSYCCDEDPEMSLSDIKVGDKIEGDYRLFSKNTAKKITVEYHN